MPKPSKESSSSLTTPQSYPETPPPQLHSSGDFTYTVEVVMGMQATLGKLTEAVDALKGQVKGHGEKLEQIGKEIHTAKVILSMCGGAIIVVGGIISLLIKAGLDYYVRLHAK